MGGVDLADQRRKYYTVARKSSKWWKYLFCFLLDTAVDNAFIIYSSTNRPSNKKTVSLYDFKLELIADIEKSYLIKKRARPSFSPIQCHKHKKAKIEGRKRTCVKCRELNNKTISGRSIESSWECEFCKQCLCKQCFD